MTRVAASAAELARALESAVGDGFEAWSLVLQQALGEEVEVRHDPPVEALDGWRDRETTVEYLRAELVAFPRAFSGFDVRIVNSVQADDLIACTVVYGGRLHPDGPQVEVGFLLRLGLLDGAVVLLDAEYLPDTRRDDLIAWLKAVEAAGGFRPPAPQHR